MLVWLVDLQQVHTVSVNVLPMLWTLALNLTLGADPHLPSGYIENKLRTIK